MQTKKIWANFRVKDAEHTRAFYTQLGFTPFGATHYPGLASFCFGEDDFVIHFFEQGPQIDTYITPGASGGSEIIFSLAAETEAEVNEWAERVRNAGGTLFREVHRDENGYYGFAFADPDGHRFNVILMDKNM
ncbi:MAG: VOC family protein [Bacteroidia bacterium]|nr:VOC family protein [Bacteroidia bacterium]